MGVWFCVSGCRAYVFTVVSTSVAAAILAAVEGGILPPGMAFLSEELTSKPSRKSAGQDARLFGRQDACLYLFTVLSTTVAQTCSLYRRVALCQTLGNDGAWDRSDAPPITNRRYGRLKICATVNTYRCLPLR